MRIYKILLPIVLLAVASCASKRNVVGDGGLTVSKTPTEKHTTAELQQLAFAQKVADNRVYVKNIVGSMSFTLTYDDKDITAPGALSMRRDSIIRIQLFIPLLGTEVGRMDFTPNHVLIVDRMHKEYIQADYNQLSFLRENGLNFHTLQSLFWNQLFIMGQSTVGESDLKKYTVDLNTTTTEALLSLQSGKMTCSWNAEKNTGKIIESNVRYLSDSHGESTLNWKYADFTNVGVKSFPLRQTFSFATTATRKARSATVDIKLKSVDTSDDWDATTTVSSRYTKVDVETILKKIMNL